MKRKEIWKRIGAVALSCAMVLGNTSAALAEELPEAAVVETAAETAAEEAAAPIQEEAAAAPAEEAAEVQDEAQEEALVGIEEAGAEAEGEMEAEAPGTEDTSEEAAAGEAADEGEQILGDFSDEEYAQAEQLEKADAEIAAVAADAADIASAQEITAGTHTASIRTAGESVYYKFTPQETGVYEFYSAGDMDTYGTLYNSEFDVITENDDDVDGNFRITYELAGGETYYFGVRYYNDSETGDIEVRLENNENAWTLEYERYQCFLPGPARLSVEVIGNTQGEYAYEWYDQEFEIIQGEANAWLDISEPGDYSCKVTNGAGEEKWAYFYVEYDTDLSVNYQDEVYVSKGGSVTLLVKVSTLSDKEVTYKWRRGTDEYDEEIPGEQSAELKLDNVTEDGEYSCVVNDGYAERTFRINVYLAAGLVVNCETDVELDYDGEKPVLAVEASSDRENAVLSYQWYEYKDGVCEEINGAVGSTYEAEVKRAEYECRVSDGTDSKSVYIYVSVDSGLRVNEGYTVEVKEGDNADFSVEATTSSSRGLTYTWYCNNVLLENEKGAVLSVKNVSATTQYECVVSDGYNEDFVTFTAWIDSGLYAEGGGEVFAVPHSDKTLTVDAGSVKGTVSYQWEWKDLTASWVAIDGAASSSYTVKDVTGYGNYRCKVSDGYNKDYIFYSVYVESGLKVERLGNYVGDGDYEKYVALNGSALLGVKATTNYGSLTYRWYKYAENGERQDITGATSATYLVKNITGYADYYCEVSDGYNSEVRYFTVGVDSALSGCKHTNTYQEVPNTRVNPTCAKSGSATYLCTNCGAMKTETLPATGRHSYGAYTVTKAATVLAEGVQTRTCRTCGAKQTASIAKLAKVIKLNVTSLPLKVKQSTSAVKVTQMAAGDSIVSWKSSNKKIATVNSKGKITGKKKGKAVITVTLASGASAKVKVTVQSGTVKTKKISVASKKLALKAKQKVNLGTKLTPVTSQQKVTYTTSNKKVATVSSKGVVTAKKKGKAKITVKSGSKKVTVTVTVK